MRVRVIFCNLGLFEDESGGQREGGRGEGRGEGEREEEEVLSKEPAGKPL